MISDRGEMMISNRLDDIKKTADEFGCGYSENELLSKYTTFGIGGRCPLLIEAGGADFLCRIIPELREKEIPFYVIGKGSNLLIEDKDIDMVFIRIGKAMNNIEVSDSCIICESGASLAAVSAAARDRSLGGMEFAYGIPGNVGGAVYMNAGAYGGEIKDIIEYAEAVSAEGELIRYNKDSMDMSYRHSIFCDNKHIITKACFKLSHGDKSLISAKMDELTEKRREKQPLEYRSAGSTFKRPEGAFAAALIEQCGLKGYTVGGAQVSAKHSGFVINLGTATFEDVMAVISHVRQVVEKETGYKLECEPEIIRA